MVKPWLPYEALQHIWIEFSEAENPELAAWSTSSIRPTFVLSNLAIMLLYISKSLSQVSGMVPFCSEISQTFWQEGGDSPLKFIPPPCTVVRPVWAHSFPDFFQRTTGISWNVHCSCPVSIVAVRCPLQLSGVHCSCQVSTAPMWCPLQLSGVHCGYQVLIVAIGCSL